MKIKKKLLKIKAKKYNKNLKKITHLDDREEYTKLYSEKDGFFLLKEDISKDEYKKLKKLNKIIKKNRGIFNLGKVIFVSVIILITVLFSIFLKNKLIKDIVVNSLEDLFEAQVDIQSIDLSLLNSRLDIDNIEITDKDNPEKNLFQMDTIAVDITIYELLKGNVHIPEIAGEGIAFGGERDKKGWSSKDKSSDTSQEDEDSKTGRDKSDTGSSSLINLDSVEDLDIEAHLNSIKDDLNTTKTIKRLETETRERVQYWENRVDQSKKQVSKIEVDIRGLKDTSGLNNPEAIKNYIAKVDNIKNEINSAKNSISTIESDYNRDLKLIKSMPNEVKKSVVLDKRETLALIGIGDNGFDGGSLISNIVTKFGGEKVNKIYSIAIKALDIWQRLGLDKKSDNKKDSKRNGTIYDFSRSESPKLLIKRVSVTTAGNNSFEGEFLNITNSNEVLGEETSFSFNYNKLLIDGALDNREDRPMGTLNIKSIYPLDLDTPANPLSINEISGDLDNNLGFIFTDLESGSGELAGTVNNLVISSSNSNEYLTQALADFNTMSIKGRYTIKNRAIDSIEVETDLDKQINNIIKDIGAKALSDSKERASKEIDNYFNKVISDFDEGDKLDFVGSDLKSVKDNLLSGDKTLDQYKSDIQNKLENILKEQAKEKLKDIPQVKEVEKEVEKVKDLLPGF